MCAPPANTFACGSIFCSSVDQYCQRTTSDVVGWPDDFVCLPLPGGCGGTASCACLAGEACGGLCEAVTGGFEVTCPGG